VSSWPDRLREMPLPRLARFALVGVTGVGVNTGMLWLLRAGAGLPLPAASALAIETAVWNNFLLNDLWTFHEQRHRRPWWARAAAFHATAATAAAINLGLLLALVTWAGMHYLVANLIAIAVAAAVNYVVSALWTWRPPTPHPRAALGSPRATSRKIVVVPTYNEAENVERLVDAVLAQGPDYEVLVVDDASPDGTGEIVTAGAAREPRLHLLRRKGKLGLGTAYVDGFQEAMRLGADLVLQMDCDFSHDPADLPRLTATAATADVAIGSRYVAGGRTEGWPWHRRLISQGTSLACRGLLGLPLRDVTGGFKCWHRQVLEELPLEEVRCRGFAFQIEMSYLCWRAGYSMAEVPVTFANRRQGRSKLSLAITLEAAALLWRLALGTPSLRRG
jgi:dolichol-phosphate mannosyltransferase